jgi:hypothetical protein
MRLGTRPAQQPQPGIEAPPIWQTDPARMRRLAIVSRARLLIVEQSVAGTLSIAADSDLVAADFGLYDIAHTSMQFSCSSVWIAPPHLRDWLAETRKLLDDPPGDYRTGPLSNPKTGSLYGLRMQRVSGGVPMGVYLVDAGDMWGIENACRDAAPTELALGLFLAARLLGMQLRFSPSYVGIQMLRQELARKSYAIPPLSEAARDLVTLHRPTYVHWCRPVPELGTQTIYKYDRNSSFIASAGEVPVGDPVPTTGYIPSRPGLYRIRAWMTGDELEWTRAALPGFFHVGSGAGEYPWGIVDDLWVWEPQIRLAQQYGVSIHIHEGYFWPQKHDLFRSWRERIWAARMAAASGGGPAYRIAKALVKKVGVAGVGRLNQQVAHSVVSMGEAESRGLRILHREMDEQMEWTGFAEVIDEMQRTDLMRPDWWGHIIAGANERLFAALYAHREQQPVAAYVDAVYCTQPWPETDLAPSTLGKWKLERTTTVSAADVRALNGETPAGWVKYLAATARGLGGEWEGPEAESDGEEAE